MTITGRVDCTSAEAVAIHRKAQKAAEEGGPPHDVVSCWCCCFDCDFNFAVTIANDQSIGVDSVF